MSARGLHFFAMLCGLIALGLSIDGVDHRATSFIVANLIVLAGSIPPRKRPPDSMSAAA